MLKTPHSRKQEEVGTFHPLPPELQKTHILTVMEHVKEGRNVFDRNLLCQYTKKRTKEEEALQATKDAAMEEHFVAIYFWTNTVHNVVGLMQLWFNFSSIS